MFAFTTVLHMVMRVAVVWDLFLPMPSASTIYTCILVFGTVDEGGGHSPYMLGPTQGADLKGRISISGVYFWCCDRCLKLLAEGIFRNGENGQFLKLP